MTSFTTAATRKKCEDKREESEKEHAGKEDLRDLQSFAQQVLAEARERGQVGPEGLLATRVPLLHLFARIGRMHDQIDEAFGGQPFQRNVGPASPANVRRFNAYFECHRKVTELLGTAIELWALSCGMKMEDDWVPIVIVYMDHQAAKARASAARAAVKD